MRALGLVALVAMGGCTWQQRGMIAGGIGVTGGLIAAGECDRACSGSRWVSYPLIGVVIPAAIWGLFEIVRITAEPPDRSSSAVTLPEPVAPDGVVPSPED